MVERATSLVPLCLLVCVAFGCADYSGVHAKPGTDVADVIQRFGPPTVDGPIAEAPWCKNSASPMPVRIDGWNITCLHLTPSNGKS